MNNEMPLITPQTKVGELLEAYPELEDVLIAVVPAFSKLRNPVLRKTVAKITSLSQAARVGGVSVVELIKRLRREVGQPEFAATEDGLATPERPQDAPEWFDKEKIVETLDVRPLINAGEQPIGRVMRELAQLTGDQVFELIAPFDPVPLRDKATAKGFNCFVKDRGSTEKIIYFART